jgi:hypothetical protein
MINHEKEIFFKELFILLIFDNISKCKGLEFLFGLFVDVLLSLFNLDAVQKGQHFQQLNTLFDKKAQIFK